MADLISIITPTYNRAKLINRAIESVLNQSYNDWELLIIDDASTDSTEDLVKNIWDPRIKYFKLENNLGNAGARNFGVKKSLGDYIVFLDSDDFMEPNCLQIFKDLITESSDTKFAFGNHQVYNEKEGTTKESVWKPDPNKTFLEELKIGTGCGILIKKECFNEVGYFDERLRIAVDTDWLIRLNQKIPFKYIPKILVTVIKHEEERVRNNKNELIKSYEIIVDKQKDIIFNDKNLILKFLYKLQWLNYHQGNIKKGNSYARKILLHKIFDLKSISSVLLFNIFPAGRAKKLHIRLSGGNKI